jgi:DNA-binding IclR family transcriptional regulator
MPTNSGLEGLDRTMQILTRFSRSGQQWGVVDLAENLGLPKSTVHRYLNALVMWQVVEQDQVTRKYRLVPRAFQLGQLVADSAALAQRVRPYLHRLADATTELSTLVVARQLRAVVVEVAYPSLSFQSDASQGKEVPLHATSAGKVLLAFGHPRDAERALSGPLPALTPATVTDPARLRRELEMARRLGYAVSRDEFAAGVSSVSVPLLAFDSADNAALSVVGATARFTAERVPAIAHLLAGTALALSQRSDTPIVKV